MHANPMVNDKKMEALKALIKAMFDMEAEGDGDTAIDPKMALEESMETPEEEIAEHAGGVTEEEEHAEDAPDVLKKEMAAFMKQPKKSPDKGRTRAIIMATKAEKPVATKMGYK